MLVFRTTAWIAGSHNSWRFTNAEDPKAKEVPIELSIEGDDKSGYHFIMDPEGFFVADTWLPTLEETLADARADFGVAPEDWSTE